MSGSTFNDAVNKARGAEKPEQKPGYIRAMCVAHGDVKLPERWPGYFAAMPRPGDFVTSIEGSRTLEVLFLEHITVSNKPIIKIHLGTRHSGDVTPGA